MTARRGFLGLEGARLSSLVGVAAASFLAVGVNVVAARHATRWDVTSDARFTLSDATRSTLHALPDPVQIWVVMGGGEPLHDSVKQLLVAYQVETSKLDVRYVDPDKDAVALQELRTRFKLDSGRGDTERVLAVVASGDRHWFLHTQDMVEVTGADDPRVRPREEQAFTHGIRQVVAGEKARLCFTTGHGEPQLTETSDSGLGALKEILDKDNYVVVDVDTTEPNAFEPFKECGVVVVAAPRGAFTKEEEARLRTYLLSGGNLLAALGPLGADVGDGFGPSGIEQALRPFGIALDGDIVVEPDPARAIPDAHGAGFFAEAREHAITAPLVRGEHRDAPRVLVEFARSLHAVHDGDAAAPYPLLITTANAFGLATVSGAAGFRDTPEKHAGDLDGPLVIAMASERPKVSPSSPRGPRVVVTGTSKVMDARNLHDPLPLRGAAIFLENAIAWLAARPAILDVPAKSEIAAGLRMTEASRSEVRRYVLLFMPLAIALLGIAVALRRRSTEGAARPREKKR